MTQMSLNVTLSPTYGINLIQFKYSDFFWIKQFNILYIQKVKSKIGKIKEKNDPTETNLAQEDFWSNKMNRNNLT